MKHKTLRLCGRYLTALLLCGILGVSCYSTIASRLAGNPLPMPFGTGIAVVISGSMEPALSVGDLLVVQKAEAPEAGDILVYQSGRDAIVHRVREVREDCLLLRGDANDTDDPPVTFEQVKGKVVAVLPGAGVVVRFLQSPFGMALVLAAAVLLLVLSGQRDAKAEKQRQDRLREEIALLRAQAASGYAESSPEKTE